MALATAPILLLPDFELPFVITTDASEATVGAILKQNQGRGLQPVAFASRKLNSTEMRYSAYERELLGIVWALGQWRHYIEQNPHKVVIQIDRTPLRFLPNQTSVNTRVWKWINVMQGYDLDIRHIPGKKNPADSLSRQLREDALGRKSQVCKEHEQWINELRVPAGASEEQIQEALRELFQQSQKLSDSVDRDQRGQDQIRLEQRLRDQYQTERAEQTRSTMTSNSVQSILYSMKKDPDQDQFNFVQDQAVLLVQRATVTLQPDLKQQINSLLMNEEPYSTILEEMDTAGSREVNRGRMKYRRRNGLLCIHQEDQSEDVEYWHVVIPDDIDSKNKILQELHSVLYSGHPGVQRTLARVRKGFYWKGQTGDVRIFVESCPVCQVEKSDHTLTRGQLQRTEIPEEKWQQVSIDFITDLPETSSGVDSIMTVIDKATRMTHVIPCNKTVTAAETARLYWRYVAKLHGIIRCIYTDRGTQFTSRLWRELWEIMGTQLRYSTAYHPQTQDVVERMNAVIGQMLRCTIHEFNEGREWDSLLPTIELAINSLPNRSTGYSPFFLNYGVHPAVPAELIKGNEEIRQETIANFIGRMHRSWQVARKCLN